MDKQYVAYRKVADAIEDEYGDLPTGLKHTADRIGFLNHKLERTQPTSYEYVCLLGLLCQDLSLLEIQEGTAGSARQRYDELFKLAHFDPSSLVSCANYYFYGLQDAGKAKQLAIYAAFVAEHMQASVWHAHQTIIRIACSLRDLPTVEISVRRLLEYTPGPDSPDPAIERDVIRIVRELDLDPALKATFLAAVAE